MLKIFNVTLLLVLFSVLNAEAQKTWRVNDAGLSYDLPESWRSDPFSTSAVCDCRGTINDNDEWEAERYIGMVVYPANERARLDIVKRQFVWDNEFIAETSSSKVSYNGIGFDAVYGRFEGTKAENKAWRLTTSENKRGKYRHYLIYFWAAPDVFEANQNEFISILESAERQKRKKRRK